eukprot:scaffold17_cov259-Chaetoceros_neogracile.AAC.4
MSSRNAGRVVINRTRSAKSRGGARDKLGKIPSLKEFVHKQNVIRQYRGFFRAVKMLNDEKFQLQGGNEVRQMFRTMQNETDKLSISMALKDGERKLKDLRSMVGYVDPNKTLNDADSWMNIKDEEDPRGRVGVAWPWDK